MPALQGVLGRADPLPAQPLGQGPTSQPWHTAQGAMRPPAPAGPLGSGGPSSSPQPRPLPCLSQAPPSPLSLLKHPSVCWPAEPQPASVAPSAPAQVCPPPHDHLAPGPRGPLCQHQDLARPLTVPENPAGPVSSRPSSAGTSRPSLPTPGSAQWRACLSLPSAALPGSSHTDGLRVQPPRLHPQSWLLLKRGHSPAQGGTLGLPESEL